MLKALIVLVAWFVTPCVLGEDVTYQITTSLSATKSTMFGQIVTFTRPLKFNPDYDGQLAYGELTDIEHRERYLAAGVARSRSIHSFEVTTGFQLGYAEKTDYVTKNRETLVETITYLSVGLKGERGSIKYVVQRLGNGSANNEDLVLGGIQLSWKF